MVTFICLQLDASFWGFADRYESLNEPAWDDISVLESPSATYTDSETSSSLDEEEELECENLISSDHRSSLSIENCCAPAVTHLEHIEEETPPITAEGTQKQLRSRRATSLPAVRRRHVVHENSSVKGAQESFSQEEAGLSNVTGSASVSANAPKVSSNLRTIISLPSGPERRPHEFEISVIPSGRRVAASISSSAANQANWEYSR